MKPAPKKTTSILLALLCLVCFALPFAAAPALMINADYRDTAARLSGSEVSDIYISERVLSSARSNADVMLCTAAAVAFFLIMALLLISPRGSMRLAGFRFFNPLLIIFGVLGAVGLRGIIELITGYLFSETGAIMTALLKESGTALKILLALALPLAFELMLRGGIFGYISSFGRGAAVAVSTLLNAAAMYALFAALGSFLAGSARAGIGAGIIGLFIGALLSLVRLATKSTLFTMLMSVCISFADYVLEPIGSVGGLLYPVVSVVATLIGVSGIFVLMRNLSKDAPKNASKDAPKAKKRKEAAG